MTMMGERDAGGGGCEEMILWEERWTINTMKVCEGGGWRWAFGGGDGRG
jgi:hypothetical protein